MFGYKILQTSADDGAFKSQLTIDHALHAAANAAVPFPFELAYQVHAATGSYLHAEFAVFHTTKANEAFPVKDFPGVEGAELSGGFDHDDAGKQGTAGDVSGDPEFFIGDIFETDDPSGRGINVDNSVQVFHVAALGIALADEFLVKENLIQINA